MKGKFFQIAVLIVSTSTYLVAGCYHVHVGTPAPIQQPSIEPSIQKTVLNPTASATTLSSLSIPSVPPEVLKKFMSKTTPEPGAIISTLTFTDGIDDQYRPLKPGLVFQNPIGHMYAIFSYDRMTPGAEWTALWYRNGKLVYFETISWPGGHGGMAYSDWKPEPMEWKPGMYEVHIFIGIEWKVSGNFYVEGETNLIFPSQPQMQHPTTLIPPTSTWTPLPTLSPDAVVKRIKWFLTDNVDCRLPCWWGIVPGKTTWAEANQFLESFTNVEMTSSISETLQGRTSYFATYGIDSQISPDQSVGFFVDTQDGRITLIGTSDITTQYGYQLYQLLGVYGKPDQVWVDTTAISPFKVNPFLLMLYYQNLNTLAIYEFKGMIEKDMVVGCPKSIAPRLYILTPEQVWDQESIKPLAGIVDIPGEEPKQLRTLDEVTAMSITTFFETYRNPNSNICIYSPSFHWE